MEIVELSSRDWKVYRYIKKNPKASKNVIAKKFGQSADERTHNLIATGLIIFDGWEEVEMNLDGKLTKVQRPKENYIIIGNQIRAYEDYCDSKRRTGVQFWFPLGITVLIALGSLAVSIIALTQ